MYSILASAVEMSKDGQIIKIDRTEIVPIAFFVFVIFLFALVIFAALYKKRLEHKQIMAAIEKGTPLSDLKPVKNKCPAWIRNITAGIALLIIAIGFAYMAWKNQSDTGAALAGFIFCGLGVCFLVRGLLLRKTDQSNSATPR